MEEALRGLHRSIQNFTEEMKREGISLVVNPRDRRLKSAAECDLMSAVRDENAAAMRMSRDATEALRQAFYEDPV